MQEHAVAYGKEVIRYRVVERRRRRTLGIEVHPDGTVVVLKPKECSDELVAEKVTKRANWISRKLAYFLQYVNSAPLRQYLSGESHRYLGRQYRLRVLAGTNGTGAQVRLTRSDLVVQGRPRPKADETRRLVEEWYLQRSRGIFSALLEASFHNFHKRGHELPRLTVRSMRTRWGSLSERGQMTLNPRLVQAPKACIEYVIVHELCHLVHKDHSPDFWRLLSRMMPDWENRKHRLEQALLS
jgi:predicted metal-dependent hydrolase